METLFGLPAHPLLVHVPVVLLPLAAAGVVVMAIKPAWHQRYRWVVLVLGVGGALGAVLAANAGEAMEDFVEEVEGREARERWEAHEGHGETAQTLALVFLVALIVFVVVPWLLERQRMTRPAVAEPEGAEPRPHRLIRIAVAVLALAGAAGSVTAVVRAGHSGADAVWSVYVPDD